MKIGRLVDPTTDAGVDHGDRDGCKDPLVGYRWIRNGRAIRDAPADA